MFPVEVDEPSLRRQEVLMSLKNAQLRVELNNLKESMEVVVVQAESYKRVIARRYNSKVRTRCFNEEDSVWRKTCEADKKPG